MTATLKNVTTSGAAIVRTFAKFGKDDVRQIRFVARDKKVTITSRGLPRLVVKVAGDAFEAFYRPNAAKRDKRVTVTGKSAAEAYKKIVQAAWH